jgi:hypothetical protein
VVTVVELTAAKTEPSQIKKQMYSLLAQIGCRSPSFPYFIRWIATEDARVVTLKVLFM